MDSLRHTSPPVCIMTPVQCCLRWTERENNKIKTVLHEWMRQWHLEWCPGQEMLSLCFCWAGPNLLSWLIVRWWSCIISRWPTFFQKGSQSAWWPNGAEKRICFSISGASVCDCCSAALCDTLFVFHHCSVNSELLFLPPRAFYLDQSNMPPSSAPKAALIDKVRPHTTSCCNHDIMENLKEQD